MDTWHIQQGGSSDLKMVTVENVTDYTDYYGTLAVVNEYTKTPTGVMVPIAPHPVNGFTLALMPEHTTSLVPKKYLVVFEISKGVSPITYRKEVSWMLEVSQSLINV